MGVCMVGYPWVLGCGLCFWVWAFVVFCGLLGLLVGGFSWVLVLCRVLVRFVASGFWFVA